MTNTKTGYWNIFNIVYFFTVTIGNLVFYNKISSLIFHHSLILILYQLILLYDLLLIFSLFLFKIKYGPFGRLKRSSFPKDRIIEKYFSSGRVGFLPIDNPIIRSEWIVFENGLGIKFLKFIKIYLPRDNFKTLDGRKLMHDSSEIYNPVITDEKIIRKLKEI